MNLEVLELLPGLPQPAYAARLRNVHSQLGEDGLLEYVLEHLPACPRYFVEFGAWDGLHLSNCAWLAEQGWAGCFIEGAPDRAQDAVRNYAQKPEVTVKAAYVTPTGESSLACLLRDTKCPQDFGVLSIDIDGNDYHVWKHFDGYRPCVVIIEFNPTVPVHIAFVQPQGSEVQQGCSLAALHTLAAEKGYVLAGATHLNAVFVRADVAAAGGLPQYAPFQVKTTNLETHVFQGYDGSVHVAGHAKLLWHGIPISEKDWQVLPPELQRFPVGQPDEYYWALERWKNR
jgi:hypothetical protein